MVNIAAFLTSKGNCRMHSTVLFATVPVQGNSELPSVSDVRLALYGNGVFGAWFENRAMKHGMR